MSSRERNIHHTDRFDRIGMVARWRPVHRGHVPVLRALCDRAAQALIGIGSSNRYDLRNPFTLEETINMIVTTIERWGMEDFAILFGSGFAPMSAIFGYTVLLPWAPIAGFVGVENPWQYIAFFDNHENIKKILNRLHEDSKLSRS